MRQYPHPNKEDKSNLEGGEAVRYRLDDNKEDRADNTFNWPINALNSLNSPQGRLPEVDPINTEFSPEGDSQEFVSSDEESNPDETVNTTALKGGLSRPH